MGLELCGYRAGGGVRWGLFNGQRGVTRRRRDLTSPGGRTMAKDRTASVRRLSGRWRWARLRVVELEDRTVPAGGVTVITHGYSLTGYPPLDWMHQMGNAIAARIGGAEQLDYNFDLDFNVGQLRY